MIGSFTTAINAYYNNGQYRIMELKVGIIVAVARKQGLVDLQSMNIVYSPSRSNCVDVHSSWSQCSSQETKLRYPLYFCADGSTGTVTVAAVVATGGAMLVQLVAMDKFVMRLKSGSLQAELYLSMIKVAW